MSGFLEQNLHTRKVQEHEIQILGLQMKIEELKLEAPGMENSMRRS